MSCIVRQIFLHLALYTLLPLETVTIGILFVVKAFFSLVCLLCCDRVFYVMIGFLWLLNSLCRDKVFICRERFFFSCPCHWLRYLLRHRNLCCGKLDLANLNSFSISVATEFSSIAIEFYQSKAFIVTTENFFVTT